MRYWQNRGTKARATCTLAAAVIVTGLGGCGTAKPSATDAITSSFRTLLAAETRGDGAAACRLMTPTAQRALLTIVVYPPVHTCAAFIDEVARSLDGAQRTRVGRVHLVSVTVHRNDASVTLSTGGTARFARVDGEWKIATVFTG